MHGSSPWDGNQELNGYPCIDQIGRGREQYNPPPWGNQALDPLYVWGNTLNGGLNTGASVADAAADWIIENRDFYNSPKDEYLPYQYPHPLRLFTPPPPPPNFRITNLN